MIELWHGLIEGLGQILRVFHDLMEPVPLLGGAFAWGNAIILLTVAVRVVLLPLAIKQMRSMRAMQRLQPQMKKIQDKYKADRSLMKTNPEKYREQRQKQQEAMMGLYKEHNVNPAASCLPLVAQLPIFFALYRVLLEPNVVPELQEARWYLIPDLSAFPSEGLSAAGIGAFALMALMALTTYVSSKQLAMSNANPQAVQTQRIMQYVMPVMLVVFAWNFPLGVLIYWVTTNLWTMGQQWFMLRGAEQQGDTKITSKAGVGSRRKKNKS